jgi:hypothetical protein
MQAGSVNRLISYCVLIMHMANSSLERHSSWCSLELKDGKRIKARLAHIGRGRFLILDDEEGGIYVDITVDASEVVSCVT